MFRGIVYLIQPVELSFGNSQCYKVGASEIGIERLKGYKNGTEYICIVRCPNPFALEAKIKEKFRKSFETPFGKEYFKGNINLMISTFLLLANEDTLQYAQISASEEKQLIKKSFGNLNSIEFLNGVYDFDKMIFHQREYDDVMTMSCGYDYCSEYKDKQALSDTLSNIFPAEESKDFFLSCIASAMYGESPDFIGLIQWKKFRQRAQLIHLLSSTFGDYFYQIDKLSDIVAKNNYIVNDLSFLKTKRIVVIENTEELVDEDILRFVDGKYIKFKSKKEKMIERININFFTICMYKNKIIMDDDVKQSTVLISTSNDEFKKLKHQINCNDFFLLLLEYLEKIRKTNFLIDPVILENKDLPDDEKKCKKFISDCLEKGDKLRVKSRDVYEKYKEWHNSQFVEPSFTNQKFFKLLHKVDTNIKYKQSLKINGKTYTGFAGLKIKDIN
jgi:hypothetical protein